MLIQFRKAALVLAGTLALAACRKDDVPSLDGPLPTPSFTVALNTTQYPVVATFTNTSTDAFNYQWDFGDGTVLTTAAKTLTHTYKVPDTYRVSVTAAGRSGSAVSPQSPLIIPSICDNNGFAVLTACAGVGATSWTLSNQPGAIVRLSATGAVLSTSAVLDSCQLDDVFSFAKSFAYSYDSGQSRYKSGPCPASQSGSSDFVYKLNGNLGQIILQRNKSFIGLSDSVRNKTYDIIEASATKLRLQGTNPDGTKTVATFIPQLSALEKARQALTGGSSRTWVLDNTIANTISVGTEAAPGAYNLSGPAGSVPSCQADDEYTFTSNNDMAYNANGQTFTAGVYACLAARTDNNTTFAFGPASGLGVAQLVLAKSGSFIGVTDAPTSRVYRILEISNTHMRLRAGAPGDPVVFTFEMKVK